jgi:cobalt ECF transporter T component CbiQ
LNRPRPAESVRHSYIDRFSRLSSPIHRLPVGAKLFGTVILLLSILLIPIHITIFFLSIAAALVATAVVSGIPPAFLLKRLLFLELFVFGMTFLSLFQVNGVAVFATLFIKSTLCLFVIVLFSNTTSFAELLSKLRRWNMPGLMVTILALMYRYLFVMVDEVERMHRARMSRTFGKKNRFLWATYSTVIAQLFIRSTERAERIYAAMCARGWK